MDTEACVEPERSQAERAPGGREERRFGERAECVDRVVSEDQWVALHQHILTHGPDVAEVPEAVEAFHILYEAGEFCAEEALGWLERRLEAERT